ncbi:MAG: hypothetical protein PVH77_10605, partial [Phycisphaerales bacterium]|jgi:hypothetical protein
LLAGCCAKLAGMVLSRIEEGYFLEISAGIAIFQLACSYRIQKSAESSLQKLCTKESPAQIRGIFRYII